MRYIYGPVKSRRLGASLGISLTPHKICSFNCVYCQLGRTQDLTRERKEYLKIEEITNELKLWLANNPAQAGGLSYITISGCGEPSLNVKIGDLIREIKKLTVIPIAVITNSSLLNDDSVRKALLSADLVIPSLNTVTPGVFIKVSRPEPSIKIEEIINGLNNLRKEFRGKIWLEAMLLRGMNDDIRQIKKLKEVIDRINPDKIQLNSPVRTTAEPNVLPVGRKKLEKIKEILGDKCEII